jgi:hypothetical protein
MIRMDLMKLGSGEASSSEALYDWEQRQRPAMRLAMRCSDLVDLAGDRIDRGGFL